MPRVRTTSASPFGAELPAGWLFFAESLGESLGRGVARGLNSGLTQNVVAPHRGPGRPPKAFVGAVAADQRCSVAGCGRQARSKGLCSAHYQADRRRRLARA